MQYYRGLQKSWWIKGKLVISPAARDQSRSHTPLSTVGRPRCGSRSCTLKWSIFNSSYSRNFAKNQLQKSRHFFNFWPSLFLAEYSFPTLLIPTLGELRKYRNHKPQLALCMRPALSQCRSHSMHSPLVQSQLFSKGNRTTAEDEG